MWKRILVTTLLLLYVVKGKTVFYDSFTGAQLTSEELKKHDKENTTYWCVNEIKPCDPDEGRRLDGSCNNLKHPTRGAIHTPFYRVLPSVFDKDFEPRKAKSNTDLPLSRFLRTSLLSEGRVPNQEFTQLLTYYMVYMAADVTGPHDTVNYVHWKPYCCSAKGKTDNMCTPNIVPDDDPVFRFSDVRCLNLTRPISFQSSGCIKNDTAPERLDSATPLLDLSTLYGASQKTSNEKGRLFKGGLLKFEEENGRVWPPSVKSNATVCYGNQPPYEKRCHATPDDAINSVLGINLFSILFWRHHNFIARELAKINPCWIDVELFETAREINIAIAAQIYYYELLPILMGRKNLLRDGALSETQGFRDIYDENVVPQISLEYPFVLRWVHTLQEGTLRMYDKDGSYLKKMPVTNLTMRTGYLAVDNNIDYITQGSFRQGCAKVDQVVDPDIAGTGLGGLQKAIDITTNDLAKNRYFGFQPYIKYREFCFGKHYEIFEDLADLFESESLEKLKEVYQDVEDIDLLAGIWLEKLIDGEKIPPTFYCLVVDQLIRNIVSDRHWYERPNRPKAFDFEQLRQLRKSSIAQILCDVGDSVTHIQQHAFLRPSTENRIGSCIELSKIDYWAWEDEDCQPTYDGRK